MKERHTCFNNILNTQNCYFLDNKNVVDKNSMNVVNKIVKN